MSKILKVVIFKDTDNRFINKANSIVGIYNDTYNVTDSRFTTFKGGYLISAIEGVEGGVLVNPKGNILYAAFMSKDRNKGYFTSCLEELKKHIVISGVYVDPLNDNTVWNKLGFVAIENSKASPVLLTFTKALDINGSRTL